MILAALLKEKQAEEEEVERNKNGGGWKISGFSVLVILGIIGLHLFLMVCICCGVKRTCWTCRKARKGLKQVRGENQINDGPKMTESKMNSKMKKMRDIGSLCRITA